jgi:hypothetical protein
LLDDLLLAPLLITRDLLSLSAAATCLLPYRHLLREIKVGEWRHGETVAMVSSQRHLHTLHVGTAEGLGKLVRSLRGESGASPGVTLRRLILQWEEAPASEDDLRALGAWLAEEGCPLLEELDMYNATLGYFTAFSVYMGLAGCPELRRLQSSQSSPEALERALELGICPKLQDLRISTLVCDFVRARIGRALRVFPRPALQELHLVMDVGSDIGDALLSGACPGLRVLRLKLVSFLEYGAVALAEALEEGACPDLAVLSFEDTCLDEAAGHALAYAARRCRKEGART